MTTFEIIDRFLHTREKDIEDYIYNLFEVQGSRDAVRACIKLYKVDHIRALEVVRCIVAEHRQH